MIQEERSGVIDCSTVAFPNVNSTTLTRGGAALELDGNNMHTISNAMLQDVGVYTCTATNEIGTSTLDVSVQVGRLPEVVSNIKFEKFNTNEFTFTWDAADGNGADVLSYDIVIAYGDKEEEYEVFVTDQSATTVSLNDVKLGEDDKDEEVVLRITVTAVNGVGRGKSTTESFPVTLGAKSSSRRSTVSQAVLGVLCVMCVALVLL